MFLESLEVTHLRNLQHLKISPHPKTNFIVGRNGCGKTSILEAISLLSNGRSFRSVDPKKVISHTASELVVFGGVNPGNGSGPEKLGISKGMNGSTLARIDGETQKRISSLAIKLPIVSIDTGSIELIDGGPGLRRSILDWGMFHVEHTYLDIWHRYRRVYKQKNALLKSTKVISETDLSYWNQQLVNEGQLIDDMRGKYIAELNAQFQNIASNYFNIADPVSLRYKSGWNKQKYSDLYQCLELNARTEIERRTCLYGPHRADMVISWSDGMAKDICSRGQKKLVLYGVRLAQVAVMRALRSISPVLLLDDLPAELDKNNIEYVTRFLMDFPCQAFITAISEQSINETLLSQLTEHHMFHVEHGKLVSTE